MENNIFKFDPRDIAKLPLDGEFFETLAGNNGKCRVERIYSRAGSGGKIYDQTDDEFVVLVSGRADIVFEDSRSTLSAGDWIFIEKHCVHKVENVSEPCVWLAIFGDFR